MLCIFVVAAVVVVVVVLMPVQRPASVVPSTRQQQEEGSAPAAERNQIQLRHTKDAAVASFSCVGLDIFRRRRIVMLLHRKEYS